MPAEGFFQRWSRLKTEPVPADAVAQDTPHGLQRPSPHAPVDAGQPGRAAQQVHEESAPSRQPTMDDVAQLCADSDYSAFVARGVDKSVQRSALKKLFADPHFNIGDGLDLYMGDYNKPDPIPAAMMSALRHTQSFFAQAYPDKMTDDEHKDGDDGRAGTAAIEHGSASSTSTVGTTSTTGITSDTGSSTTASTTSTASTAVATGIAVASTTTSTTIEDEA